MIGKEISPILTEIEDTLWEFEFNVQSKPEFSRDGMRAAIKIFMAVLMDKAWELQEIENMSMEDRGNMVTKLGQDVRALVKTYTDIDTFDLFKLPESPEPK